MSALRERKTEATTATTAGLTRALVRNQNGMVLPIVLVLLALGILLIAPTLGHGFTGLRGTEVDEDRARELYAADSGAEEGLLWLINDKPDNAIWSWDEVSGTGTRLPYTINGATVNVTVQTLPALGPNYYGIQSVATYMAGTTTIISRVWASAPPIDDFGDLGQGTYHGDAYIEGDSDLHGTVDGNVVIIGDLTLKDNDSEIGGDVTVSGDYYQNAQSTVLGNVCAGGNVTLRAFSTIEGHLYVELDDGESATIELTGQATLGDIYVATAEGDSAHITIILSNKDEIGNVYVMSSVALTTDFHTGATHGDIVEDWDGVTPPTPLCAGVPVGGGAVIAYEIS